MKFIVINIKVQNSLSFKFENFFNFKNILTADAIEELKFLNSIAKNVFIKLSLAFTKIPIL